MRLKEALEIQKLMMQWCFFHEGIIDELPEMLPTQWTLKQMLLANETVEKRNKMQRDRPFINGKRKTKTYMTIDDRAIAALYTAMNYEGCSAESAKSINCANGNYVYIIRN